MIDLGQRAFVTSLPELDCPMFAAADAARLAEMTSSRVSRWLRGYSYRYDEAVHHQEPVVHREGSANSPYASFLDLIDLLFVKKFLDRGISLQKLRRALSEALCILGTEHFARQNFFTDGHEIYLQVKDEGDAILHLLRGGQWAIPDVIRQLAEQIEFDIPSGYARRWFPLGPGGLVVIDPTVSFGRPTIAGRGIATSSIYDLFIAERRRIPRVKDWFEIGQEEVAAAIQFEERFTA